MSLRLPFARTGHGPPLLLQGPAWGPSNDYLRQTLVPLLSGFEVITYDPRNVGGSPRVADSDAQSTANLVADLEAVREAAGRDRVVLAGHSHGGFIAMGYAARHPERVAALLLLHTRVRDHEPDPEAEEILRRFASDPRRREAVEMFRVTAGRPRNVDSDADLARRLRRLMPAYFYDLDALRRFAAAARGAPPPSAAAIRRMPEHLEDWVAREIEGLPTPTLVVTGRHDVATTSADALRIAALLPAARVEIMECSGHHSWVEEPRRFTDVTRRFLQQVTPAATNP